jgi:hypothetical protein
MSVTTAQNIPPAKQSNAEMMITVMENGTITMILAITAAIMVVGIEAVGQS